MTILEATPTDALPLTPAARGPVSSALIATLTDGALLKPDVARSALAASESILTDEDLQLTLFLLYALHYGEPAWVRGEWEWNPQLIAIRSLIEARFEAQLCLEVPVPDGHPKTANELADLLFELTGDTSGPSLARWVAKKATLHQLREFMVQRSIYTLMEADPHSWAIPRLRGRAKVALVEIQADEYGGGHPDRMHATIFARSMEGVGLDSHYGAYLDFVPAITLASLNMMSMFGLQRRLRGAISGHLAAFEMTSAIPSRQYGNGFRRLGFGPEVTLYFDEHVEADAVHEQIAARDLAGALAEDEPEIVDDIIFGAAACLHVDGLAASHILDAWQEGRSSLLRPLP